MTNPGDIVDGCFYRYMKIPNMGFLLDCDRLNQPGTFMTFYLLRARFAPLPGVL